MAVVAVLAVANVLRTYVVDGDLHLAFNLAVGATVVVVGVVARLDRAELGLRRDRLGPGLRLGALAAALIALVLVTAALAPPTSGHFADDRADLSLAELLVKALVVIPLGTVLVEELAFRGVLHGLLRRRLATAAAVGVGAVLFGAWHVLPVLHAGDGTAAAAGTFVATTVAGVGFGWLRVRSDSLLAPILAHTATNSLALVVAWALGG